MKKDEAREAALVRFNDKYPQVIRGAVYARQLIESFIEGFDAGWAAQQAEIGRLRDALTAERKAAVDEFLSMIWECEPRNLQEFVQYQPQIVAEMFGKEAE